MAHFRRRRRRRAEDDPENHDRWLVSYADFITLLFAFFVVMYGISSINEGKYRVMSDAIVFAFRSDPGLAPGAMVATGHAEAQLIAPIRRPPPKPAGGEPQAVDRKSVV